jgi:hypothetical protein
MSSKIVREWRAIMETFLIELSSLLNGMVAYRTSLLHERSNLYSSFSVFSVIFVGRCESSTVEDCGTVGSRFVCG